MEKVNILYSMLCRYFHDRVVKNIRKDITVGNEIAVTEMYRGETKQFNNTYECCDAYYGQYYKFKEYKDSKPVDDEIIDKMSPYAMEILKMMDRKQSWDMSFEDRMQLYFEHIRFWNHVLDYYEINRVVFLNVPHEVFDYVIYCLCKIKNIKMSIVYLASPYFDRSLLFNSIEDMGSDFKEKLNQYTELYKNVDQENIELSKEGLKIFETYEKLRAKNDTEKLLSERDQNRTGMPVNEIIRYMTYMDIRHMLEKKYTGRTDGKKVAHELVRYLDGDKKMFRYKYDAIGHFKTNELINYYNKLCEKPNLKEKYILFTLHYQPEATSAPMGGGIYSNQLVAIQILAANLPKGMKLYVKEHREQAYVGRIKSFYDRIKIIRNVQLISTQANQYELIKNSVATATLTGTIALESVFFNKPCIVMGEYLYKYLSGVYYVRTNDECKSAVRKILSDNTDIPLKDLKVFFKTLYDISIPINLGYGNYNAIKNANILSEALIKKIGDEESIC